MSQKIGRKKRVAKSRAFRFSAAAVKSSLFTIGQRVQVLTGDYGNARGHVVSLEKFGVVVVSLNIHHGKNVPFESSNLRALGLPSDAKRPL